MILRCTAPRKQDPTRRCGQWLAAVPDGCVVLGILAKPADAHPESFVVGCRRCHALHEIAVGLPKAA